MSGDLRYQWKRCIRSSFYECCTCTVHTATITMSGMTNTNIIHVDCSIVVTFIFLPNLLSASLSTWLLLVMRSSHVAKQMLFIIDKKCTALNIVAATKKRELCYCMAAEAFFTLLAINELHFEWMQCANDQRRQSKTPLHRMKIGRDINHVTFGKLVTSFVQKLKILGVYRSCKSRYWLQISFIFSK